MHRTYVDGDGRVHEYFFGTIQAAKFTGTVATQRLHFSVLATTP
jgi:hypothetical protein